MRIESGDRKAVRDSIHSVNQTSSSAIVVLATELWGHELRLEYVYLVTKKISIRIEPLPTLTTDYA